MTDHLEAWSGFCWTETSFFLQFSPVKIECVYSTQQSSVKKPLKPVGSVSLAPLAIVMSRFKAHATTN